MNSTKELRNLFGLTQLQLANYLGVDRSLVALAETGKRSLPTKALIKMAALHISLNNNTAGTAALMAKEQQDSDYKALSKYIKACKREALAVQRRLETIKNEYQQQVRVLMATDSLMLQNKHQKKSAKDQLWLELVQAQTLKKMKRCGMAEQVKLMLKEQALRQTIAAAEAIKF